MGNLIRRRASRNGALVDSLPLWLAADGRDRRACRALAVAGRWLQARVPGLEGAVADTYASANGLGVRHDN